MSQNPMEFRTPSEFERLKARILQLTPDERARLFGDFLGQGMLTTTEIDPDLFNEDPTTTAAREAVVGAYESEYPANTDEDTSDDSDRIYNEGVVAPTAWSHEQSTTTAEFDNPLAVCAEIDALRRVAIDGPTSVQGG